MSLKVPAKVESVFEGHVSLDDYGERGSLRRPRRLLQRSRVIVVDADIDARNWKDVMWALSTRMDPARDITVIENTPIDYLDFASPVSGLGSKIGLDATDKFPGETIREGGRQIRMDQAVVDKVDVMWSELGLPGSGKKIWE